jgi:hypothetical protein
MKEKLDQAKQCLLQANGRDVYCAYSLLDMATNGYYSSNNSFLIDEKKQTFKDYVNSLILRNSNPGNIEAAFVMGETLYKIQLRQENQDSWKIVVSSESKSSAVADIQQGLKKIHEYTSRDFIFFCQKYSLTFHQDEQQKFSLSVSAQIKDQTITLGGKDKIELYQIHLVNLEKMLTHVSNDGPNPNMLVDMATGSGKSFTQALWFLILYLSDISCTFAVPRDDLAKQLAKDFQRLIPETVTHEIKLDGESKSNQSSSWTITTHQNLLKKAWSTDNCKNSWICFDEEHEASGSELFKKRINELETRHPLLFLSATPSENAYVLCRNQGAMVSFSRKQKIESKIAQPITACTVKPKDIIKAAIEKSDNRPNLLLDIGETPSSAAHAYLDACDSTVIFCEKDSAFYRKPKPDIDTEEDRLRTLRWNVRVPWGEKALIHARQPDVLINFFNVSQGARFWKYAAYKNGQQVHRYDTPGLILSTQALQDIDITYSTIYEDSQVEFLRKIFLNYLYDSYPDLKRGWWVERNILNQIDFSPHYKYLQYRVLHGLIETTLKYLTGYTSAQLDAKRFNNLSGLVKEVQGRINQMVQIPINKNHRTNIEQITKHLIDEAIPQPIAKEIAALMLEIILKICSTDSDKTKSIVDNWQLDKKLHGDFLKENERGSRNLEKFVSKHCSVFFVNGLDNTAHAIQSNRPFHALRGRTYYANSEEVKNNPALQQLAANNGNSLFVPNHQIEVFEPTYLSDEYSSEVIDILYKKGLIGAYVTSERVSGFNDPDLHHVAILIEDNSEGLNDPTQSTQGAGRIRALNPAKSDFFFLSVDRNVVPSLPAESLDDPNFYTIFFQAKKNYHKKLIHTMGKNIAKEMESWVNCSVQPNGEIDIKALEAQCQKMIFEQFEVLYNQCDHDFKETKQAFLIVLEHAYKALYQNSKILQSFYSQKFDQPLMKAYVFVVNLIGGLWYKLKTAAFYFSFTATKWTDDDKEKAKNVDLAKKNLAAWIQEKKEGNLKINLHGKYIAWAMSKIKASTKGIPSTGMGIFIKEVILGSNFSDNMSKIDLRLPGDMEPEKLIEAWMETLKDHCTTNKIEENEMKVIETHLKNWVNRNTTVNFPEEFNTWQQNNSGNQGKTMDDFLKEKVFGNADVSCHFNDDYSLSFFGSVGGVDAVHRSLEQMVELQNPSNFDHENTYKYIIQTYRYDNLISSLTKLNVFMQSVSDEISKADNKKGNMPEDVVANISRYFKMPLFAKEVNATLDYLPDEHLLTILNVIYPQDRKDAQTDLKKERINNQQKILQLRQLTRDCNRLSAKEFFHKYLTEVIDINASNDCISWFFGVLGEIKDCLCYYHRVDEHGNL